MMLHYLAWISAAACPFVLALEREVVADDAAGLRSILVIQHRAVREMTQRRKMLLHVEDVAVCINALHGTFIVVL
jgi:hypothetical protein